MHGRKEHTNEISNLGATRHETHQKAPRPKAQQSHIAGYSNRLPMSFGHASVPADVLDIPRLHKGQGAMGFAIEGGSAEAILASSAENDTLVCARYHNAAAGCWYSISASPNENV